MSHCTIAGVHLGMTQSQVRALFPEAPDVSHECGQPTLEPFNTFARFAGGASCEDWAWDTHGLEAVRWSTDGRAFSVQGNALSMPDGLSLPVHCSLGLVHQRLGMPDDWTEFQGGTIGHNWRSGYYERLIYHYPTVIVEVDVFKKPEYGPGSGSDVFVPELDSVELLSNP